MKILEWESRYRMRTDRHDKLNRRISQLLCEGAKNKQT